MSGEERDRTKPKTVYIGLGSNLENPQAQVIDAFAELAKLERSRFLEQSPLYLSDPMGPAGQPNYVNAVAKLETSLLPLELLDKIQAIELQHGRIRTGQRWGARTLDLDLLLYGDERVNIERLTVPHPGIKERNFVLYPLADVASTRLNIPGVGDLGELLAACSSDGIERLSTDE